MSIPYDHRPADDPYFRLLRDDEGIHVVCLQWFDESDYDENKWIEDRVYTDQDQAEAAASVYRIMDQANAAARWRAFVADLLRFADHTDDCSYSWTGRGCSCGLAALVVDAEEALHG